ncbi:hypothetical protein GGX14DRAFT_546186 [Mycena pura]|uniref:Uncharacterized protein n=1 Tax=Mycena pura TaxID=153505 RepID=A0AAD6UWX0_9AGAR|nr:hypothetical protein GGX14DRAFT_546186 [Mycena pura]
MVEPVLYASVTLPFVPSVRAFTATLRTKRRRVLAGISALTLGVAIPRLFDDFWGLVSTHCTHIAHLSLSAADLDALQVTRLRPRHLSISFIGQPSSFPTYNLDTGESELPGPWGHVSHLSLYHNSSIFFPSFDARLFPGLTHFSCYISDPWPDARFLPVLQMLLALPSLRFCVLRSELGPGLFDALFMSSLPHDRRIVVIRPPEVTDDSRHWEFAEREVASRRAPPNRRRTALRVSRASAGKQGAKSRWSTAHLSAKTTGFRPRPLKGSGPCGVSCAGTKAMLFGGKLGCRKTDPKPNALGLTTGGGGDSDGAGRIFGVQWLFHF